MARLKADGCIRSRQGSGAYLAALPGQAGFRLVRHSQGLPAVVTREIAEVLELRLIIETGLAELAALRRAATDIQTMEAALCAMDKALDSGDEAASDDDAFHVAIAAATRSPQLERFQIFMGQQLSDSRRPTWDASGHLNGLACEAQLEHRNIFDAIVSGDPARAREAARAHIEGAMRRFGIARGGLPPTGPKQHKLEEKTR